MCLVKIELVSLRLKDSTTLCGLSGSVFQAKDHFVLTLDTDLGFVSVSRNEKPTEIVPVGNVVTMTPKAQPPAKK